ncbi:GD24543 [Drosophila simulans]|uniref:GD24543 n=1 Tax=Drosophila simulans TaxID=7240 RepID=B4NU96_DROSI|nr:GD24543 [Drosophila simulans]
MSQHSKKEATSSSGSHAAQSNRHNNSVSGGNGNSNSISGSSNNKSHKRQANGNLKAPIQTLTNIHPHSQKSPGSKVKQTSSSISWSSMQETGSSATSLLSAGGKAKKNQKDKQRERERLERGQLVLWRRPLQTTKYCGLELFTLLRTWSTRLVQQRVLLATLIVLSIVFSVIYKIDGPHQFAIEFVFTCGHFLVPFWTFFGATLIGKAVIKMHIQKIFVIIAFNETLIERAVDLLATLPVLGPKLQEPFKSFLNNQKQRLHRQQRGADGATAGAADSGNLLSRFFETFVIGMVCYFVVSIVNSLAQSYHKRLHKKPASPVAATTPTRQSTGASKKAGKQKALRD